MLPTPPSKLTAGSFDSATRAIVVDHLIADAANVIYDGAVKKGKKTCLIGKVSQFVGTGSCKISWHRAVSPTQFDLRLSAEILC